MALDVFYDEFQPSWEEEGLFARDLRGQLIRVVEAREEDYFKTVTVTIDGRSIQVPRAVPTTDAQGKIIYLDAAGRTRPRRTTIYDAALALCLADVRGNQAPVQPANDAGSTLEEQHLRQTARARLARIIPSLCHLDHLTPVGVCRICSVELAREEVDPKDPTKKTYRGSGKLVPACVQPVEDRMFVNTLAGEQGERVRKAVKVLLELLAADHIVASPSDASAPPSELERLLTELNHTLGKSALPAAAKTPWLTAERFAPRQPWNLPIDDSSPLVRVDPNACILCDRCSRACNDVKHNHVIGRTGKGYSARIGFDLNDPMGGSSCVECGECMLSCPTTALTFREPVEKSEWFLEQVGGENPLTRERHSSVPGKSAVSPAEMDENELLRSLPWRHREWNQYSVIRWRLKPGEELCQAGDYGATAFLLQSGTFEVVPPRATATPITLTTEHRVLGEMTCLNYYPRSATVRAKTTAEVFEVRRNVLFALQRVPESREILMQIYRRRAIESFIRTASWFRHVSDVDRAAAREFLLAAWQQPDATPTPAMGGRLPVELIQLEPGQIIYREGELADAFYVIRIGHVKVSQASGGVIRYLRPVSEFGETPSGERLADVEPSFFGEIGCLADWPEAHAVLPPHVRDPRRTATCTALDHVELVRIDRDCFRALLSAIPALKAEVLKAAATWLAASVPAGAASGISNAAASSRQLAPLRREFVDQGLYNSQRLLVLDLEACTRCDECTKACSDTHQGITRLIRDGARIDKWLVASSCRSCSDPYCLVGCPVDAIHRDGRGKQIRIESHCIGCGLCANNCPYGNINMHPKEKGAGLQWTPTTCDLCNSSQCSSPVGPDKWREVNCVFACPHNAALRMSGEELWQSIEGSPLTP
jgi:Fe-S-cluster-containing dehydrogenase component